MSEYKLHGEREASPKSALPVEGDLVHVKDAVRLIAASRADGPMIALDIDHDDLLEVELDDGFTLWTTIDRLREDTRVSGQRAADDTLFPATYPTADGEGERGFGKNVIRAVRVLGINLPEDAARIAAGKIEDQLQGDGQFFRLDATGNLTREDPQKTESNEPTLVLIHGTASSTVNAFSGLFSTNQTIWGEILTHYNGRVYGFENRTLTKSPLENAIEFLKAIPTGANLHLVTHSRGGLIGDLIAHGRVDGDVFDADDIERELQAAYKTKPEALKAQRELYNEFNLQIATALPDVSRYVRVGCPAAGTTLASRRLDIYVSILVNLVGRIPGVGPILGGLGELAAAVAKQRTQPEVLPGLEAQMPTSAFVRLLNGSPHVLTSDLTVLAGDSDGLFKNLANLFYWRANDLVVDTRSMYGGAQRQQRLWHLEENRQVTHVNYFRRHETAQVVRQGLLRADHDTTGFQTRKPKSALRGHVKHGNPTDYADQPAVILLPGIMGSHLDQIGDEKNKLERAWLDKLDLMRGHGKLLKMGAANIEPSALLSGPYDDFRNYLVTQGIHVLPMAYDWRASLNEATPRLDKLIRQRLAASQSPLHIVAHSMGGLVASLFMAQHGPTWSRLRDTGGRLIQVGTPNRGSYAIPQILRGQEKTIQLLAQLDADTDLKTWTEWASEFDGILEMSPDFDSLDFWKPATWVALGALSSPSQADLGKARKVRKQLAVQTDRLAAQDVLYVAGGPAPTPVYASTEHEIRYTERGDGRVTWDSGIPSGVATWYIAAKHGSLLNKKDAFEGLAQLILAGETDKLSTHRPSASATLRGEPADGPPLGAARQEAQFIPTNEDLEKAALMMDDRPRRWPKRAASIPQCKLSVVHGDLRFSRAPIVVGHYRGDQIVHAEDALDRCLDGALRSRHQLGIYPGKIGSAEVVLRNNGKTARKAPGPTGAIVLGLGDVGVLTPGGLTRSIQTGLLRYAQACIEHGTDTSSMQVAALLVGSGESGVSVTRSIESFLIAAANVNRALTGLPSRTADGAPSESPCGPRYFANIEFVELYKDLALEALHALYAFRTRTGFTIDKTLKSRAGGRERSRSYSQEPWWSRLQITCQSSATKANIETLEFTAYGERARASGTCIDVQKSLIDRLISDAIKDRGESGPQFRETLFELLIPRALKGGASDGRDIQLLLDSSSAAYPWELLTDRRSENGTSLSIGAGMLRQLRVGEIDPVTHPEENRILVIGDPPSKLPPLLGAQHEAEMVAKLFSSRGSWDVTPQIRNANSGPEIDASSIVASLTGADYRILHLAGHGVYDASGTSGSGMVIGDSDLPQDPFVLINSALVENSPLQPELVFINCCHLGRIERTVPLPRLAANLGEQFIRSGAKAVIAAGWPVDDDAASTFCSVFYEQMLDGADFGEAVTAARGSIRDHRSNTYAAYQCYGDPGFRLLMDSQVRSKARGKSYQPENFLDVSELRIELDNLANSTTMVKTDKERAQLETQLDDLRNLARQKGWLERSGVLARIARIYAELEDFETAINVYEKALATGSCDVTLSDLERLVNLRVRLGRQKHDAKGVTGARKDLERLIKRYGETPERHSLMGSAYKRLAQLQEERDQIHDCIKDSAIAYIKAAGTTRSNWYYPSTNALLEILLLGGPWKEPPDAASKDFDAFNKISWANHNTFHEKLDRVTAELSACDHNTFWDAAASASLSVVRAFADGTLHSDKDNLLKQYVDVIRLYGSDLQIASVSDQWQFAEFISKKFDRSADAEAFAHLHKGLSGLSEKN